MDGHFLAKKEAAMTMEGWQTLGVKTSVLQQIRELAAQDGTTMSNVVRRAVDMYAAAGDDAVEGQALK